MNTIVTKTEVKLNTKPERNRNAKSVYCITDGKVYASGADAAKANGVHPNSISAVCLGRIKATKGKKYCFVSDMQSRIIEISEVMQNAVKDADAYKVIKAEQAMKEAKAKKLDKLQNKIAAREEQLEKSKEELNNLKAMLAAMEAEFNV
jgi:mevalonate kinase